MVIFLFNNDFRLNDNGGLHHALLSGHKVLPVLIINKESLNHKKSHKVRYFKSVLKNLHQELQKYGSSLLVKIGETEEVISNLVEEYSAEAVYMNKKYDAWSVKSLRAIEAALEQINIPLFKFKDYMFFENKEILKNDGLPYTVYTPYKIRWKLKFEQTQEKGYESINYLDKLAKVNVALPDAILNSNYDSSMTSLKVKLDDQTIMNYKEVRDLPAKKGTTLLSIALNYGIMSIREAIASVKFKSETLLDELIWRDFFIQIGANFPKVYNQAFKTKYDNIDWINNDIQFEAWCKGNTGIPIVDAGMRELNSTGFMHNRVRMVTASFLIKNLLIDYKWGEAYFAEKLIDFEPSINNCNWQWVAGTGCDSAPYFRVFNPVTQQQKFDKNFEYIKKWVPEFGTFNYPKPMVDLKTSRVRALAAYKLAVNS